MGAALAAATLIAPVVLDGPTAWAGIRHRGVVGEHPVASTPHVLDGRVKAVTPVGDLVVVAGRFERVASPDRGETVERHNIFAFERGTGEISHDFAPEVDGTVTSVVPGPGAGTVHIAGHFDRVEGADQRGVALLSTGDGDPVSSFDAGVAGGSVYRADAYGDHLYLGGSFDSVGGKQRSGLARVNARTGAPDPAFDISPAKARRGNLRVHELAVSPRGNRLVIAGTFTRVEDRRRYQIAVIDTAARPAALADWSTESYAAPCDQSRLHTYMRQIDFAPDGSYFAVVTTGGPEVEPGLCKTAARWETYAGPGAEPTWVNHTGGDSLYAVEATGAAVYVGGHQRWMDNPEGDHKAGPGAVERSGIAAIDPRTGRALAWNPGRTRGHGAEALTSAPEGLYVGSDTTGMAGTHRGRLGMFPL
ncbi:hypothetical protein ACFQZ2_18580 [Streptomonospora algeriensis]|uniref:PKD domain-containing protein n=1 Tax=Streptomonospora algeriensis TaxID=995084 RepID=A0ABW3BJN3_9ACTN